MDDRTHRAFKDQLYAQFARAGKALGNGRRLELLDLLAQRERTVEDLARRAALSVANASQHLRLLHAAGLVEVRREGLFAHYRLADETVFRLWQALRTVGETRLAEVERTVATFLPERAGDEPIGAAELAGRLRDGGTIVLDVRPRDEYDAGHLPGARSVPLDELEGRLADLPPSQEIIVYCRGPYCVFADESVARLRARGYRARRLDAGLPDWRAAGLPVEVAGA